MSYDDESIRKAREKGIFNDSFDPLALGLSADEKKRMAKGFEGAQRDLLKQAEASGPKFGKSPNKKKGLVGDKAGFFERVLRFIIMLFTGSSKADYENKRRIKELKQAIKRLKPPVYNFQTETITGEFAILLHNFLQLIWPYHIVFEDVFGEDDAERHLDFQLFYLRSMVASVTAEDTYRFTEDGLKEFVRDDRDSMVRKRVDEMADIFLRNIDEESRRKLNRVFAEFINMKELLGYNFFSLLRRFNSSYSVEQNAHIFHDIRPEGTGEALKDLETVLLAVNTKTVQAVCGMAAGYFEEFILPRMDAEEGAAILLHFQKMDENGYRSISASLGKIVNGQLLGLLIRYITKNFEYETHIYPRGTNFFEEFGRGLISALEARVTRVLARRKQEEVDARLKELFETLEPMPDYLYSEATNVILGKLDLPDFIYPTAFYVGIRFFAEKYFQYIKRVLNKLIVDGSFKDSLARRTLSDEFYRMDELSNKLITFSHSINVRKEKGSLFQSMLQKFKGDLASKKALGTRIAIINQELHAVLQEIRDCTSNLQMILVRIGHDIDAEKPEIVDNLHKIGATGNARFLGELRCSIRETVIFSDVILKVFKES